MEEVFDAFAGGQPDRVIAHWWPGLKVDPRWMRNRGIWSIGARALLSIVRRHLVRQGNVGA
jgi:hypothetical protein